MVSIAASILILIAILLDGQLIVAGESYSSEKIIIHVPYKIHNHLHTHTNYKVIKMPEKSLIDKSEERPEHEKEEEKQYLKKQFDTILSGTKVPPHNKHADNQFLPQTFPTFTAEPSPIPIHSFHHVKESQRNVNIHGLQNEGITPGEIITSSPTKMPTLSPTYHTTVGDRFGEGKLFMHTLSTKAPFVPLYNADIVSPTYQVVEKESKNERVPHKIIPYGQLMKPSILAKSSKNFARNYFQKNPYSIRSGKFLPTAKAITMSAAKLYSVPTMPTGKLYSVPTMPTKTFSIPTGKSFLVASTKPPKTLFKNNEEYEHIGYLVVGENSQQFVGVNDKKT